MSREQRISGGPGTSATGGDCAATSESRYSSCESFPFSSEKIRVERRCGDGLSVAEKRAALSQETWERIDVRAEGAAQLLEYLLRRQEVAEPGALGPGHETHAQAAHGRQLRPSSAIMAAALSSYECPDGDRRRVALETRRERAVGAHPAQEIVQFFRLVVVHRRLPRREDRRLFLGVAGEHRAPAARDLERPHVVSGHVQVVHDVQRHVRRSVQRGARLAKRRVPRWTACRPRKRPAARGQRLPHSPTECSRTADRWASLLSLCWPTKTTR